jgi:site-specific DNA-methyltransferase (adenine-specific)
MEMMAEMPDWAFDLAIVDPPFGLGEGRKHSTRTIRCKQRNGAYLNVPFIHSQKDWDDSQPEQGYFDELFRVSRKAILFGENYLQFNQHGQSSGRIFWDKLTNGDFSDGEILWTNLFSSVRRVTFMWSGFNQGISIETPHIQQGNKRLNERRIHPTQKPVALYKWLLTNYAKPGDTILDTHLGSGSSRIAAYDLGFEFYGTELDTDYFNAQEERFANHVAQGKLFTPESPIHEQGLLI